MNTHQVTLKVNGLTFTVAYSDLDKAWMIESNKHGIHALTHETLAHAVEQVIACGS